MPQNRLGRPTNHFSRFLPSHVPWPHNILYDRITLISMPFAEISSVFCQIFSVPAIFPLFYQNIVSP
jgi:hypothetical protein